MSSSTGEKYVTRSGGRYIRKCASRRLPSRHVGRNGGAKHRHRAGQAAKGLRLLSLLLCAGIRGIEIGDALLVVGGALRRALRSAETLGETAER